MREILNELGEIEYSLALGLEYLCPSDEAWDDLMEASNKINAFIDYIKTDLNI